MITLDLFFLGLWILSPLKFPTNLLIASRNSKGAVASLDALWQPSFGCVQFHGLLLLSMKLTCTPLT
jgi:hypothetical protein